MDVDEGFRFHYRDTLKSYSCEPRDVVMGQSIRQIRARISGEYSDSTGWVKRCEGESAATSEMAKGCSRLPFFNSFCLDELEQSTLISGAAQLKEKGVSPEESRVSEPQGPGIP